MSIEPSPSQAARLTAANTAARLPNFCNLGIMLRLMLLINALCVAGAAVRADSLQSLWPQFLSISMIAQPVVIASLLLSCALRPVFSRLAYWQGVLLIVAMEMLLALLFWYLWGLMVALDRSFSAWQFGFFFVFITGAVLLYFDLRSRALSPALTEARLQALQARIRPHFLFNTINAALSLIRRDPRRAERVLEDMADLFRVLMADNRQLTPLADEVALCQRYLEIEQLRLGDRLIVRWHIDHFPGTVLVPPLILQPLIENAVYHGIEPKGDAGELAVEIQDRGKQILIRLTNPYHNQAGSVAGNRMAIANIRERLQLHFDAEASLKAETSQTHYIVTITLPKVSESPRP
ncbi:MAG: histidine kinase [Betaproteobacteria bacterium]|nr:histidine kinase [Betaproteobacteria bacterium]